MRRECTSSGWPKPKGLGPEYGGQFRDQSIANAYPTRPPYPPELFDILLGLIQDQSPLILDLGCGTGDISRSLAPHVRRIDAVDPSSAMIARGQALPGGQHPNLRWIVAIAEEFIYPGEYALVVTAESLHWMDWYTVLPRIHRSLTPHGRLAIVLGRGFRNELWAAEVGQLISQYSTNREYERYDLLRELAKRKLFVLEQMIQTQPVPFSQTVEEYVESFHSRNGLSRDRMGSSAKAFDAQLETIIAKYQSNSILEFELIAGLAWGIPAAG
jgi:ubiquinone/menaquinone biosynthesis C-methylase UbiE